MDKFEAAHSPMADNTFWSIFMEHSRAVVDFNVLFRQFHQYCSVPDEEGINKICEKRLAQTVNQSVKRIHFHGLDVEMANLTVE